jgi:gamma-glutamylputrescine oxidase
MSELKKEVYWYTKKRPEIRELKNDAAADVIVVGGGISGLSAAQKLAEAGQKVILLECSFCGGGASGKSSGFITPDSENQLVDLIENYGQKEGKRIREFSLGGVEQIRNNIKKYSIDCDYQIQDSLSVANSKKAFEKAEREHQARLSLGYDSQLYKKEELPNVLGSSHYFGAVRYGHTFGINAFLYCQGMKEALLKEGIEIYENTRVDSIESGKVKANGHTVSGKHIVVATDQFLPDLKIKEKYIYHVQTFLVVSKPLRLEEVKKIFREEELMIWDSDLIYQYFRLIENNRLLFGAATLAHSYKRKESQNWDDVIRKIQRYLRDKFSIERMTFEYSWPGLIGITKDLMPIAGEDMKMKNVFYISGTAGLPWAAALGNYIAEKIINGRSDFDQYFQAERKYPIGDKLQKVLSKPPSFALSNLIVEYFE